MKYLKNRQQFLNKDIKIDNSNISEYYKSSALIREATMQNDITWGGSLLGRLINSIIRKSSVYFKSLKINNLVKQVEKELDELVIQAGVSKKQKSEINSLTAKFLIEEIYTVVRSDYPIESKLTKLISDGKSYEDGLLNQCIKEVEKLTEESLSGKDELLEKLKDFRDALRDFEFEPQSEEEEEEDLSKLTDSEKKKNPEFNFFWQTSQLFKSLIDLNIKIQNKRVLIEGEKEVNKIELGEECLFTNKSGIKNKVMVISVSNAIGIGVDKKWFTKDDFKKSGLAKDTAFVIFQDKNGKYTSLSPQMAVDIKSLSKLSKAKKEGIYYQNESLSILENVEKITKEETQTRAAWKKILGASKIADLPILSKLLQEIIDISKSGSKLDKTIITAIGKNIILNESTTGKPIGLESLIKEEAGNIPAKYSNVSKNISLLARILLSFKDDMGLIGSLGEAAKPIKDFISSYNQLKETFPKLSKKNESNSNLFDFNTFKVFEKISGELDRVEEAWFKFFEEGEEKEWSIDEKKAKELQEETDKLENEPFPIEEGKCKDNIIRIINIFGKAYRIYATDVIPSGRPEGRVSQKTFREYTYIGDGSSVPGWDYDSGPGYGPWAAKVSFEKWDNGIMKILEDQKYRKILANARFLPKGTEPLGSGNTAQSGGYGRSGEGYPEKIVRAGRSLLDFINDLLSGQGEFKKTRKKIIKEYFSGADEIDKETQKEVDSNSYRKSTKEDEGEDNTISFNFYSSLKRTDSQNIKMAKFTKEDEYGREFFRIKCTVEGKDTTLIGFFMGILKGSKENGLVIKFQISKDGYRQSLINRYLDDKISKGEYKLYEKMIKDDTLPLNVGVINITKNTNFKVGGELDIKYSQIIATDQFGKIDSMIIKIKSIESLAKNENSNWEAVKIGGKPDKYLTKDITNIERLRSKIKEFGIE